MSGQAAGAGCLHRASSLAAHLAAKDTPAGASAPGGGREPRWAGGSGQPQLVIVPAATPGLAAGRIRR